MKQDNSSELDSSKLRRLNRLVNLARGILLWERIWGQAGPLLILGSLFTICVLFDLFPLLAPSIHVLILGIIALLGLMLCGLIIRNVTFPTRREAVYRLEKDSNLAHHPLIALLDRPAGNAKDKITESLWVRHQDRMAKAMQHIALKGPRSTLRDKDPHGLSALLILALVLGSVEARNDYGDRLQRVFSPITAGIMSKTWLVQAWITPPAYTGLSPLLISANPTSQTVLEPILIPQHSHLLLRLEGSPTRDKMSLTVGPFSDDLKNLGKGIFTIETDLDQGDLLNLQKDDSTFVSWPIRLVPDLPPTIEIQKRPKGSFRGHFTLDYKAVDDYGLNEVSLSIRALNRDGHADIVMTSSTQGQSLEGSFRGNFADHPWAGKEVILTPKAKDNAEQVGLGLAVPFILPERHFKHPLAKGLINLRKSLYDSAPEDRTYAHVWLSHLLKKPEDFGHDVAIYLSLRVASDRLGKLTSDTDIKSVQAILWETAVRLDEGASGTVRDQLEFMSQQMQDLMQQGASSPAMEALFESMRQSLDQFLQQMMNSQQTSNDFKEAMGAENVDSINRDELMEMLQQARDLMRAGETEAAKALMDQFQSILSRIAMQKQPNPKDAKQAQEIMEQLRKIEQAQQNLLDKTFNRNKNTNHPSLSSTHQAIEESEEQLQIIQQLKDQMAALQQMKTKPSSELIEAENAMQQSAQSLQNGRDEGSIQAQIRALDALQKGLKESATRLSNILGMQSLPSQMPGYDPLGRGVPARTQNQNGADIPTEAEMQHSREILNELYRRARQSERAQQELKYIERLLERF
jgi:uncharacterized protein (TIGR02302 family)